MQTATRSEVAPDYAVIRLARARDIRGHPQRDDHDQRDPAADGALHITEQTAQWLSTAFMLTMAAVIPITGWFLQRVSTRGAFATAMGVFCSARLLAAVAPSFEVLLVARVVQAPARR